MAEEIRIAVVGTPRSGNTWIRLLLAAAYRVPELALHRLTPADWATLPPQCILQIHANRTEEFARQLADHRFRVVTVARHPLDTLISILQFAVTDGGTHNWLEGRGGDESGIFACTPRSRCFVEYASSPRANALFSVTRDWWQAPGVVGVRYEEMVADPAGELGKLCDAIAPPRESDLISIAARHTVTRLRSRAGNGHFWQGRPGQWRELLPEAEASEIASAIPDAFSRYGYICNPDPTLTVSAADANWVRLAGPSLRAVMQKSLDAQNTGESHRRKADEYRRLATEAEDRAARSAADSLRQLRHIADLEARLEPLAGLGNFELRIARWLGKMRKFLPGFAGASAKS